MTDVLTRETAIPNMTAPNGRKFKAEMFDSNPHLWVIAYDDGKPGELPEALTKSRYTSRKWAEKHIERFLNDFWDKSDAAASKLKSNKAA